MTAVGDQRSLLQCPPADNDCSTPALQTAVGLLAVSMPTLTDPQHTSSPYDGDRMNTQDPEMHSGGNREYRPKEGTSTRSLDLTQCLSFVRLL